MNEKEKKNSRMRVDAINYGMNTDEKLNQSSVRHKKRKEEKKYKRFLPCIFISFLNNTVSIMILRREKNHYIVSFSIFYPGT